MYRHSLFDRFLMLEVGERLRRAGRKPMTARDVWTKPVVEGMSVMSVVEEM